MNDTLPGYEVVLWFGAMAPRGTPAPILDRLNGAINEALKQDDIKKTLEADGMRPTGGPPEAFGKRIRVDYDRWVKLVKEANIDIK